MESQENRGRRQTTLFDFIPLASEEEVATEEKEEFSQPREEKVDSSTAPSSSSPSEEKEAGTPRPKKEKDKVLDFGKVDGGRKTYDRHKMAKQEEALSIYRNGKKDFWPQPDFEEMRSRGYKPEVAAFLRNGLYRSVPRKIPTPGGGSGLSAEAWMLGAGEEKAYAAAEGYKRYVESVKSVADSIPPYVDLVDARSIATEKFKELFLEREGGGKYRWQDWVIESGLSAQARKAYNSIPRNPGNFRKYLSMGWDDLIRPKAKRKGKGETGSDRQENPKKKRKIVESLKHVSIVGPDWETPEIDGKIGEWMMDTFDIRGGEFGNWLSQQDRIGTLRLFTHSAKMMTAALDLPDRALGLRGELAVAWGSRGKAGTAGHYEPMGRIFNLTKYHGAGSFAHEYFHALHHQILRFGMEAGGEGEGVLLIDGGELGLGESIAVARALMGRVDFLSRKLKDMAKDGNVPDPFENEEYRKTIEEVTKVFEAAAGMYELNEAIAVVHYPELPERIRQTIIRLGIKEAMKEKLSDSDQFREALEKYNQNEENALAYLSARVTPSNEEILKDGISTNNSIYYSLPQTIKKELGHTGLLKKKVQAPEIIEKLKEEGLELLPEIKRVAASAASSAKKAAGKTMDGLEKMAMVGSTAVLLTSAMALSEGALTFAMALKAAKMLKKGAEKKRSRTKREDAYCFSALKNNLLGKESGIYSRSQLLDGASKKSYFKSPTEMLARSFERYCFEKTKKMGWRNDYLVGPGKMKEEGYKRLDMPYPYPTEEEMRSEGIGKAFDRLIDVVRNTGLACKDNDIVRKEDLAVREKSELSSERKDFPPLVKIEASVERSAKSGKTPITVEKVDGEGVDEGVELEGRAVEGRMKI